MRTSDEASKASASFRPLLWLMVAVVGTWAIAGWLLHDVQDRGTIGDMFGAVNALFSGLAFAGVIYAILLQRKELELQRYELTETRRELEGQKLQLERQAFENAFFQMLSLHNEIVTAAKYRTASPPNNWFEGKECFAALHRDAKAFIADPRNGGPPEERYEKFYDLHAHAVLGHYFRNLYQIVKYVDRSNVADKKFYTNIVRAQLNSDELYLLFYNALSRFGREKFMPLVSRFEFLEHLPLTKDLQVADAAKYGVGAFGADPDWNRVLRNEPPSHRQA